MKSGLLIVERIVLEALFVNDKNMIELCEETGLDMSLVRNLIQILMLKNLVLYESGKYKINRIEWNKQKIEINGRDNMKYELREMFTSLVNRYFAKEDDTKLRYRKVYLTSEQEIIFRQLLSNLDTFMENIEKNRGTHQKIKEKRVVIWGHSEYAGVINDVIKAV